MRRRKSLSKVVDREIIRYWNFEIEKALRRLRIALKYKYATTKDDRMNEAIKFLTNIQQHMQLWSES